MNDMEDKIKTELQEKRKEFVEGLEGILMEYPKQIIGWHGKAMQLRVKSLIHSLEEGKERKFYGRI